MDFITPEEARQNIVALGVPQIVLDVFDEKPLPYHLDLNFCTPYMIFSLGQAEQRQYGQGRITPLWTNGAHYTVVAYHHDPSRQGYFRFDIEKPGEEEGPIGLSWQQILIEEFQFLWEFEMPDDRLREVARLFEFKHIELLVNELSQAKLDTSEKSAVWYQSILKKVGD
jgi:hypothetical protein